MSTTITEKNAHEACQFAMEEAVANERAIIAEMLKKLEDHFWYPMASKELETVRRRVGL